MSILSKTAKTLAALTLVVGGGIFLSNSAKASSAPTNSEESDINIKFGVASELDCLSGRRKNFLTLYFSENFERAFNIFYGYTFKYFMKVYKKDNYREFVSLFIMEQISKNFKSYGIHYNSMGGAPKSNGDPTIDGRFFVTFEKLEDVICFFEKEPFFKRYPGSIKIGYFPSKYVEGKRWLNEVEESVDSLIKCQKKYSENLDRELKEYLEKERLEKERLERASITDFFDRIEALKVKDVEKAKALKDIIEDRGKGTTTEAARNIQAYKHAIASDVSFRQRYKKIKKHLARLVNQSKQNDSFNKLLVEFNNLCK